MQRKTGRVLIADDWASIRRVYSEKLRRAGYDCKAVSSGDEALEEMKRAPVAVLVADLVMPGMTGLELIEKAKVLDPRTHFVLWTGNEAAPFVHEAHRLGARFVIKGGDTRDAYDLISAVDTELELYRRNGGHHVH
jgi:DNA-binding NtrC family response regulator